MTEFLSGVYIGLGIVGLIAGIFAIIGLVYFLAKNNIFITFVEEGTAKTILKFGKFSRAIMTYEGYGLDTEWTIRDKENEVDDKGNITCNGKLLKNDQGKNIKLRKEPLLRFGGLRWVGIPLIHSVHRYNFRWISFEQGEEEGNLVQKAIPHEKESIDYILVQDDVYYSFVREAETDGMVPVNLDLLLIIRIINPYKALFRVQNWLEAVQNQLKPALRGFTATLTYEKLIQKKEQVERETDEFLQETGTADYLERNYGVRLKRVGIVHIDPSGERGKTYVEAASKKWEADKEKERIEVIADAEVERLTRVYGKIESYGDTGLFIRATEAIEETGKGSGNLVVFPFGSVQQMLEGWLGKKKEG